MSEESKNAAAGENISEPPSELHALRFENERLANELKSAIEEIERLKGERGNSFAEKNGLLIEMKRQVQVGDAVRDPGYEIGFVLLRDGVTLDYLVGAIRDNFAGVKRD